MLGKNELLEYRTFNDPYQIEKDYLHELILYEVYSKRYTTDSFVFKGGTALSKFYHSGRFSEDLDFNAPGRKPEEIAEDVGRIAGAMPYKSALAGKPATNKFGTMGAEVLIEGPRYNGKASTLQHISFEINTAAVLEYAPLPITQRPQYRDLEEYTALVMDMREIIAEKVRAIMSRKRRHRERDLYDMYFLTGKEVDIKKEVVMKKLEQSHITLSRETLKEAIASVEKSWEELDPFVVQKLPSYERAKQQVLEALERAKLL